MTVISFIYVLSLKVVLKLTDSYAHFNDDPVNFSPTLFEITYDKVGSIKFMIGLSMWTPNI